MNTMSRSAASLRFALAGAALSYGAALAQPAPTQAPTFAQGPVSLWLNLEAGAQIVGERNAYWNLGSVYNGGIAFGPSRHWYEAYMKPGLRFSLDLSPQVSVYGGLAALASYSLRQDIFVTGDTGRVLPEQAYAGVRLKTPGDGLSLDLSAGQQEYRLGSGMLIANGAGNGFERGALIFGPRRAWASTAIAKIATGALSADVFVLDGNELQSNDTATRLAGGKLEYSLGANQYAGLAYFKATHSTAPYIQAAPNGAGMPAFILDGRHGLETVYGYARYNPLASLAPGFWLAVDGAAQRNERVDLSAWAARMEFGNAFVSLPWAPTLSYTFQTFSGDNPRTKRLERFDPLFYDGSPAAWVTGSNGSFVFINTNVNAHKLTLRVTPSAQDIITLRYTHIRANELNSPLQFGQATRLASIGTTPILASGVQKHHLSDDILAEYTRVVSPNIFFTVGVAASYPGAGIRGLLPAGAKDWYGGFANIVVRY